jgi:hypothetical protein
VEQRISLAGELEASMADLLGLQVGSTLWHLADNNPQDVAEQIRLAMADGAPLALPLANNGYLVLRTDSLAHAGIFTVYVPDQPAAVTPRPPLQPGIASGEPGRTIM